MLKAGAADGSKLAEAYISPVFKGFGAGLNNGWFNTAKAHKSGGFDLTISLNAAFVPSSDQTFDASKLNFDKLRIVPGTGPIAQTVSGEKNPTNNPEYALYETNPVTGTQQEVIRFASPAGTGVPYSGAPVAQLGVGIYKNTDLMIRFVPKVKMTVGNDKAELGLLGFGVKHDIKQWIPGMKDLPFDLSAYFGYTSFNYSMGLSVSPDKDGSGTPYVNRPGNTATYDNQKLEVTTRATTFGAIISKKISILTVYGSLGYGSSNSSLDMTGDYPVTTFDAGGARVVDAITDPVSLDIKGANGLKGTAGFRLKMAVITLHADYTFSQYPIASAGIGFAFR